jgi:hypothetical protein
MRALTAAGRNSRKMDRNVTPDQSAVEQLLSRIREKVQMRANEIPQRTFSVTSPSLFQKSDFYPLQELKEYAAAAYTHHKEVGGINPRHPGLFNNLVQSIKKAMQRMLAWYTRPLHLFQAPTARALMEISRALEDIQQKQLYMSEQIVQLESEQHSEITKLKAIVENIQSTGKGTADLSLVDSHGTSKSNQGQS